MILPFSEQELMWEKVVALLSHSSPQRVLRDKITAPQPQSDSSPYAGKVFFSPPISVVIPPPAHSSAPSWTKTLLLETYGTHSRVASG